MLARGDAAIVRLWLWRIAALKLLLPFSLLFALGEWLGFPSAHSADPAPPDLVRAISLLAPFVSPARVLDWTGLALLLAALAVCTAHGPASVWMRRQLRVERARVLEEAARRERDPDDIVPRPGFFDSALLSACVYAAARLAFRCSPARSRIASSDSSC